MQRKPSEIQINLLIFLTIELEKRIDLLSVLNLNENDTVACAEKTTASELPYIYAMRHTFGERKVLCMA